MEIIGFLLIVSLLVAIVFLGAFIWNVKSDQYEDDYSPAHRIFFEDEIVKKPSSTNKHNTEKEAPLSTQNKSENKNEEQW